MPVDVIAFLDKYEPSDRLEKQRAAVDISAATIAANHAQPILTGPGHNRNIAVLVKIRAFRKLRADRLQTSVRLDETNNHLTADEFAFLAHKNLQTKTSGTAHATPLLVL
jgi:hypothetical protein